MSLTFTGERFLPECAGEMVYEHWHRYLIARDYVQGKRVLDVASGEGYGSHMLAQSAANVTGVDLSADAVDHATAKYGQSNICYVAASCTRIPAPDASFDVIVSFETIEHMMEHEAFIQEVDRLLAPGGLFIISSPNRTEYSDRTGYKNEFHVKELDKPELKTLLDQRFPEQRWFGQRAAFHSMVWPLDGEATSAAALAADGAAGFPAELYYLVFCARTAGPIEQVAKQLTLVTDREQSVYAEWSRTYRENASLHEQLVSLQSRQASEPVTPVPRDTWLVRLAKSVSGQSG